MNKVKERACERISQSNGQRERETEKVMLLRLVSRVRERKRIKGKFIT